MRRGGAAEKPFYLEDPETMESFGFNLGADYCAEHEWGLRGLRPLFGCDEGKMGVAKRTITRIPETLKYRKGKDKKKLQPDILAIVSKHNWEGFMENPEKKWGYFRELEDYRWKGRTDPPTEFLGAWSGEDFGIAAYSDQARARLETLVQAFEKKDVAFWIGGTGGNPFARGGFCLAIVSKFPPKYSQIMLEADLEAEKLEKADQETGIKQLLEKAGKRFFALSPKWKTKDSFKDIETKHPVVYWLNPMDQHLYDHGWYSVEQLELWAANKGPIIKERKKHGNG